MIFLVDQTHFLLNFPLDFFYQYPNQRISTFKRAFSNYNVVFVLCLEIPIGRKCPKLPLVLTFAEFQTRFLRNTGLNPFNQHFNGDSLSVCGNWSQERQVWIFCWNLDWPNMPKNAISFDYSRVSYFFLETVGFFLPSRLHLKFSACWRASYTNMLF